MWATELAELRQLHKENVRMKRLMADLTLKILPEYGRSKGLAERRKCISKPRKSGPGIAKVSLLG